MALNCKVDMDAYTCTAGQSPAPRATITVYNTGAAAVTVTGVQLFGNVLGNTNRALSMPPSVPPTGPGATISVPTLSSITFGPFPVVFGSAANVNPFAMVNQSGNSNPTNPQASQPATFVASIGATVYGSDSTVNDATPAAILVSHSFPPPVGSQGGFLNFSGSNNFLGVLPGWP